MDRLKALFATMTTEEISQHPMLAVCYIYDLCQQAGIPIATVTAAIATGDFSDLKTLTKNVIDLSPTYWQDFTSDALNQAADLLGGEL